MKDCKNRLCAELELVPTEHHSSFKWLCARMVCTRVAVSMCMEDVSPEPQNVHCDSEAVAVTV